jgi:hypothetical protein
MNAFIKYWKTLKINLRYLIDKGWIVFCYRTLRRPWALKLFVICPSNTIEKVLTIVQIIQTNLPKIHYTEVENCKTSNTQMPESALQITLFVYVLSNCNLDSFCVFRLSLCLSKLTHLNIRSLYCYAFHWFNFAVVSSYKSDTIKWHVPSI